MATRSTTRLSVISPPDDPFASLGAPARRALAREGITTVSALATYTQAQMLAMHGIGPNSIPKLVEALRVHGLTFALHASIK